MGKEDPLQQSEKTSDNLWNAILSEASRSVNDRLESRTLLILGKTERTSYIASLL